MSFHAKVFAFSGLILQTLPVLAHPRPYDIWDQESNGAGNVGNTNIDGESYDYGYAGDSAHVPKEHSGYLGHGHCGGKGHEDGHGGGSGGFWPPSTVTVSECSTAAPTATITVTINDGGDGFATITETISDCTLTTTSDTGATATSTVTDTLISSVTDCTATSTDITTVTEDSPPITSTVTTAGPTVTDTVTIGDITVTVPGSTETETETNTITTTDTTTITNNQIITSTETDTQTETVEATVTVTADDCTPTNSGGGLDYGTCSDPYILYQYGLDGRTDYAYTTRNQADFPFGSSPDIYTPAALICNRLRSPCNAPQETLDQCAAAMDAVSGLSGQEAADEWNSLMT